MDLHRVPMKPYDPNRTEHHPPSLWKGFADFDRYEQRQWFEENWSIALYLIAGYVTFIYTGQEFMRNRKPLNLKRPIVIWNSLLAIFSIAACMRILPEFYEILAGENGFHKSVCASCQEVSDQGIYWGWLFTLSKVVELGDTVFLILRKRKLIFLHWYHHITVLLYCWSFYSSEISTARWFICVNYLIHAIMYSYYTLRSLNVSIPKKIAMSITSLQLSQMIIGVMVNVYAYNTKLKNVECDASLLSINASLTLYASYFLLFANFFRKAYLQHGKDRLKMGNNQKQFSDANANVINPSLVRQKVE